MLFKLYYYHISFNVFFINFFDWHIRFMLVWGRIYFHHPCRRCWMILLNTNWLTSEQLWENETSSLNYDHARFKMHANAPRKQELTQTDATRMERPHRGRINRRRCDWHAPRARLFASIRFLKSKRYPDTNIQFYTCVPDFSDLYCSSMLCQTYYCYFHLIIIPYSPKSSTISNLTISVSELENDCLFTT